MTTQSEDVRTGTLRTAGSSATPELSSSQKLMIFVLSMSLFGLSNVILEIIPDVSLGPVEVDVSYFVFVPLTMVALFSPFWAALGAPLGEIVFTDLLMGDFSGLAEVEGFIQMFLALYIAGSLIRNPRHRGQLAFAAIMVVVIDKMLSAAVDLTKVFIGVEDAEFVDGLPESVLLLEGTHRLTSSLPTSPEAYRRCTWHAADSPAQSSTAFGQPRARAVSARSASTHIDPAL